jgi:type VI secretion system secreted protein VgrG
MADTFQLQGDSPVVADLMFWRIAGHEVLSRPSHYELTVLSKESNLKPSDILGYNFDLIIDFKDKADASHQRHCTGHATRFIRMGEIGRYYRYQITLQSWFGLLKKRINSRILQDKKIVDNLEEVFADSPIKAFKKLEAGHVIAPHAIHRYCVQFEESDYQFASRLMEEEGIYYWFDAHKEPGTMLLSDTSSAAHDKLPAIDTLSYVPNGVSDARFNEITHWSSARSFSSGKYASTDSDFKAIKSRLKADKADPDENELADLEIFEFSGDYWRHSDTGERANIRMQELSSQRQRHWAHTAWPDVAPGKTFTFKNAPEQEDDGDYLIAACSFIISHSGYEGINSQDQDGNAGAFSSQFQAALTQDPINAIDAISATHYTQLLDSSPDFNPAARKGRAGSSQRAFILTVIPADEAWTPPRQTPKVKMPGPQSAIVVGPAGEEIHADDFGRVKVHFHWDRYDESNEKSTAYIRVNQPWAGKNWGGYFIPRIGQEVIVDFLNGDPDRPIIMGRVYNDDQPIPFESHTQSGFRTRSTPGGSPANCNEFRFDDKKGAEQVYLHAEKNQDISVENDETHTVGHDRTKTIDNDETNHIKHDRTETVDNNETITVGVDRKESVGNNETIAVGVNRTETVGANESINIGANRTIAVGASETATVALQRTHTVGINETIAIGAAQEIAIGAMQSVAIGANQTVNVGVNQSTSVGANQSTDVGANRSIEVGANLSTKVGADESRAVGGGRSTQVGKDDAIKVGKNFVLDAGDSISLKTGSASITMKKDGTIIIKGKDIKIDGSGKINIKASSDIVMKGSKILQN